jgi:hypothetical protein
MISSDPDSRSFPAIKSQTGLQPMPSGRPIMVISLLSFFVNIISREDSTNNFGPAAKEYPAEKDLTPVPSWIIVRSVNDKHEMPYPVVSCGQNDV